MYSEKDIQNLDEIKTFLDENEIDYSTEYDNFCLHYGDDDKRSYEIEYVPSLKYPIAYPKFNIEGVDKNYFFDKSYKAEHEDNSFKLWIKDFEWKNPRQREVLKSYILHAANKTPNRWYARDCEVKTVDPKTGRQFELDNCFYGKKGASLSLGLYSKKEKNGVPKGSLIMIYTFGKNFFGKDENLIEIIRVGTLKYSHVVGGSSKLLKHFIRNYKTIKIGKNDVKVGKLKFYSDYDHNIGGSMDELGFEFVNYSKGGFLNYWIEEDVVKQREPMRHKWVMEQMKEGKCFAIPNAGVKTYVLDFNKDQQ
jgi:hypothetical protein